MKRERLIILLGVLVALVFFYLGLNEWLKTKEEQVQPPPLVVKPSPQKKVEPQAQQPPASTNLERKSEQKKEEDKVQEKQEIKEAPKTKEQDVIAQKIKEEKKIETLQKAKEVEKVTKAPLKTYTVQIGAFKSRESAEKVAERARKMGYKVTIVEEDNFYKVRVLVKTNDINSELRKLRGTFGGAIVKQ